MSINSTGVRQLVLGFTPKGISPEFYTMPENFDVELQVVGEEVVLIYAGAPRAKAAVAVPENLRSLTKSQLLEYIETVLNA